jgi:methylornithine synthase
MNFVPQPGTPMEKNTPPAPRKEALILSVLRLVFPDRLIQATLDVAGLSGLEKRLDSGANVVTSIIPRGQGLAGVAQHSLDIEAGRRTHASVLEVLRTAGLQTANTEEYLAWINRRQRAIDASKVRGKIAC